MNLLEQKIESLPANPGVYLFKDRKGVILYVGKAGNIKHRVNSYFQRAGEKDAKTLAMLEKVEDIETIVTDTEKEALILEENLVKEHHPRYNVKLRDDKRYPCLRLSIEEEFPTLTIVRRIKKNRSLYFGPYPSATSLKETLKLIRRLFPIRTCLDTKLSHRLRPCINYEMGRCSGPCCGEIDSTRYREIIHQVKMFLEGRNKDLLEDLKAKMEKESEELHFEAAARIRDQIKHIEHVIEKQKIVSRDFLDQDVIGFHRHDHTVVIHPLFVRGGKLLGGRGFTFPGAALPDEEVLSSFIRQYYHEGKFIPEQILIPKSIPEQNFAEQRLTDLKGKKVSLLVPRKGERKKLLQLARENAERYHITKAEFEKDLEKLLEALKEQLHLAKIPRRIEAFDISNLQGGYAVGSMVSFENGKPNKDRYRHFKIKTIEGADDYGMMYEVLLRRYRKAIEANDLPDLVLLDGGKGQLNVAQRVFKELPIKGVDLISLAKGKTGIGAESSAPEKSEEKVFRPQIKEPFRFMRSSPVLHLLDRIRDEAHRFAITYHKKVRKRGTIRSVLEEIPGIGRTRQRELLNYFGSVDKIKGAPLDELIKAPKMTPKSAQSVYDFFPSEQK
ncbi:MAG: excinuclease ABC subunit C [Deltaproteobacteria bacterium RBG_16_49_23]|nr:MAG: excinuclease ABC subunit C [Deltaproteobacteria bacterium RBG_16_49_23]